MSNQYYDHGLFPAAGSMLSSAAMRAELEAIEAGFEKLPTPTGNAGKIVVVNPSETGLVSVDAADKLSESIQASAEKTVPVDADEIPLADSDTAGGLKRLTWANIKIAIKGYYDSVSSTLTNKSVSLSTNTLTGTTAQFNAALSDGDFATLAGTEILTNKTINIANNVLTGVQATLVSGTNIKTVNSTSLVGSGNVAVEPTVTAGTTAQYYRGDKSWQVLDKAAVGLGSVDNTTDANKPISTATQTALNGKQPLDGDLTAIAALVGTTGLLRKTAADVWTLDTSAYVTSSGVTSVSGTAPIVSSGGATPAISISAATTSAAGSMSAADKTKLDGVAIGATANTGTVTSVGITPPSEFTASASITTSGNITLTKASQTANHFWAAPNGSAGAPAFRAIVASDIPTLNQNTTGTATNVTGTVAIANGGTGATTAAGARTALGATTVGGNMLTLPNPTATTFLRVNADNSVSTLDAAAFRTAIGAGSGGGTVISVGGTGTVSGLTLSGTVTSIGDLTLGGTLAVTPANFASQTANTVLAAPNGSSGAPTFRALVASDVPTLNQNTTGTAENVTGTVAIANGGTGATSAAAARTSLGLGNVDNTSDAAKPVSTATQTALNGRAPLNGVGTSGTWPISVTGNAATIDNFRAFGTINVAPAGPSANCTTAQFISHLSALGMLSYGAATAKVSWDYAGNNDLTDTGFGTVELAGCVIETWVSSGTISVRLTRPNSGTGGFQILMYTDHGPSYNPGWRALITNENFNGYSPTLTGGGAYGTWGINVSGSAGSISGYNNPTTAATANTIAYRDSNGDLSVRELILNVSAQNFTPSSLVAIYPSTNQAVKVDAAGARSFLDVPTKSGSGASGTWGINISGTAGTVATFSTNRTNYKGVTDGAVAGQLMWKNYGNSHTIFDASAGTSPDGSAVNNTNAASAWSSSYPTLMGWNGSSTYGVRVDSARIADSAVNGITTSNIGSYAPTLTGSGASGTWGINVTGNAANASRLAALSLYSFSASTNARDFPLGIQASFVSDAQGYISYGSVVRVATYVNDGGGAELYFPYSTGYGGNSMRYRMGQYDNAGWTGWKTVIDDTSISAYAPSLTGSGASGTWGINITGNAGSAYGLLAHTGRNNESNKVVRTDSNGYLQVGYINSSNGNENNASSPPRVWGTNGSDDYLRTYQTSSLSVGYAASSGTASAVAWTNVSGRPTNVSSFTNDAGYITSTASVSVIGSSTTAVSGGTYVLTASLTLTLPASPTAGMKVTVVNRSGTSTPVIGRNGQNIMGLAEDMTLNSVNAFVTLTFADATRGWVLT